jgi:hypothetical protein
MGCVRPDGLVLQFILVPDAQHGLNVLPFFSGDFTPHKWRVSTFIFSGLSREVLMSSGPDPPLPQTALASNPHHACAALGIAHVRGLAVSGEIEVIARQRTATIISKSLSMTTEIWVLDVPGSDVTGSDTRLVSSRPHDDVEKEQAEQRPGIYKIGLWAKSDGKKEGLTTLYGKLLMPSK